MKSTTRREEGPVKKRRKRSHNSAAGSYEDSPAICWVGGVVKRVLRSSALHMFLPSPCPSARMRGDRRRASRKELSLPRLELPLAVWAFRDFTSRTALPSCFTLKMKNFSIQISYCGVLEQNMNVSCNWFLSSNASINTLSC
jgi:hypothetical protein